MKTQVLAVKGSLFINEAVYFVEKQVLRLQMGKFFYYYYGVTQQKVNRFKNAHSKGKYFCTYIKGQYEMAKRKLNNK